MRTRQEIKAIGKERFQSHYWPCVGTSFLITGIIGALSAVLSKEEYVDSVYGEIAIRTPIPLGFLVTIPLIIGLCYYFIQLILGRDEELSVGTVFKTGFTGYGRKLGGYLWMQLFTFLWSLLLVVPGIIKSYSYAMTPYILSDCPNVRATDALKLSMRIMRGRKADLFVFHLSFLGWAILSTLTAGILAVFYVYPYFYSSSACWYLEAREAALRDGVITMGQLEGTEPV